MLALPEMAQSSALAVNLSPSLKLESSIEARQEPQKFWPIYFLSRPGYLQACTVTNLLKGFIAWITTAMCQGYKVVNKLHIQPYCNNLVI